MIIKQIDETPIGNSFHDSGVTTIFNALAQTVDEFEVDSDQLNAWCEYIIKSMKTIQAVIKDCEKKQTKKFHEQEIEDKIHRGAE